MIGMASGVRALETLIGQARHSCPSHRFSLLVEMVKNLVLGMQHAQVEMAEMVRGQLPQNRF